jgi:hypothetical protein
VAAESPPLADDTSADAARHQIELWRRMTPAQKLALVSSASHSVQVMAAAGMRQRYPQATEREIFLRLAVLRLGHQLALEVFPEVESLAP